MPRREPAGPRTGHLARAALTRSLRPRVWNRVRLGVDVVILYVACAIAVFADDAVTRTPVAVVLTMTFPLLVVGLMSTRRGPDARLNGSMLETATHVLGVVSLATIIVLATTSIFAPHTTGLAMRLWLFASVYLGLSRSVLLSVRRNVIRSGLFGVPTLVVGAGMVGTHLTARLTADPSYGLRPVGLLDSDPLPPSTTATPSQVPILGGPDDLALAISQTGAERVILAFSNEPDHVLVAKARECQQLGIDVSLVPRLFESINERATLDHIGGIPLLTLKAVDPRGWQFAVKHAIDRLVALLALVLLSPVLLLIALIVRLTSPGPALFRQERVGRDGHEFTMLKFRSMRGSPSSGGEADAGWATRILQGSVDAVEDAPATVGVDRTTAIGRLLRATSCDELPQLINVLKGDMSLVGPRPERVAYVRDFERSVDRYTDRHRVKSGLTGWAQVNGLRGETSIADRIEWDNYYIQNWSLRLDARIIALTIIEVLRLRETAARRQKSRAR